MLAEDLPVHVLFLGCRGRDREPVGGELHLKIADPIFGNQLEAVNPKRQKNSLQCIDFEDFFVITSSTSKKVLRI